MTDTQKLTKLLSEQKHIVLAVTLDDGTPWTVPLHIRAHDGFRTFEWDSHVMSEHSKVIAVNPSVAMTMFQNGETSIMGFYAKGTAELIEEFKPGFGHYRLTVVQAWINDETFKKRAVEL